MPWINLSITYRLKPWVTPCVRLIFTACLYHLPERTALRAADWIIRRGMVIGGPHGA